MEGKTKQLPKCIGLKKPNVCLLIHTPLANTIKINKQEIEIKNVNHQKEIEVSKLGSERPWRLKGKESI